MPASANLSTNTDKGLINIIPPAVAAHFISWLGGPLDNSVALCDDLYLSLTDFIAAWIWLFLQCQMAASNLKDAQSTLFTEVNHGNVMLGERP